MGCASTNGRVLPSMKHVVTTSGLRDFARLLYRATQQQNEPTPKRVELDSISVLSLLASASWNINLMLLDRFLRDLRFQPDAQLQRACRYATEVPVVVLVAQYKNAARTPKRAHLVYAECGRYRAAAAFFEDAVALIRAGEIVACPITALDEAVLTTSSLFALHLQRNRRVFPEHRTPPGA